MGAASPSPTWPPGQASPSGPLPPLALEPAPGSVQRGARQSPRPLPQPHCGETPGPCHPSALPVTELQNPADGSELCSLPVMVKTRIIKSLGKREALGVRSEGSTSCSRRAAGRRPHQQQAG